MGLRKMMKGVSPLPDEGARRRIKEELDRTLFVEAGAGSGKTESLVDRMIALLGAGKCTVGQLAALTFTRKAAAELRGRFQIGLEKAALRDADPEVKERLKEALRNLEQCSIGTIHSFCARLLRERPIEIGLDPSFTELEEIDDAIFRAKCWTDYLVKVRIEGQEVLRELDEAGLAPQDLEDAFDTVSLYPEVEIVGGRRDIPDYEKYRAALEQFLDWAGETLPQEKPEKGYDGLQRLVLRCLRRQNNLGFDDHRVLMETFELLEKDTGVTQNKWPSKEAALAFKEEFDGFRDKAVNQALKAWREYRHDRIIRFLGPAVEFFEAKRKEENKLNFGDLLMLAARLLRENPEVRGYFSRKFTHVLVDEFQDTDPIQSEVLMYLKGENAEERDWRKLRPKEGSLFLVGDPKQSIYRFRRADIDTYSCVKAIAEAAGGDELSLTANFRSLKALADWNNPIWKGIFPAEATQYQAGFAPIVTRREDEAGCARGVHKIVVPKAKYNKGTDIAEADADMIANWICWASAGNIKVGDGTQFRPAQPSDFLILFRYKKNMNLYARALEERGIPFEITGSDAFSESEEIGEITNLALALSDPDNPIDTVAVLRGVFCGASDEDLVEFKREGGRFNFMSPGLDIIRSKHLGATNVLLGLQRMKAWRDWTLKHPPSAALHKIFEDSGIINYLVSREMGSSRAGNMLKLLEIVRNEERKGEASFMRVVKLLEELAEEREIEEISLTPGRAKAVRLMNLHKAKGLEAPVVFLANPSPPREHEVDKHIVRLGTFPRGTSSAGTPLKEAESARPRGFFAFYKPSTYRQKGDLLSCPVGWAEAAEEEKKYQEAEEQRLMYVAATRARDMLVISTYAGDAKNKPWKILDAALSNVPEVEIHPQAADVQAKREGRRQKVVISKAELERARKAIEANYEAVSAQTYQVESVTSLAKKEREVPARKHDTGLGLSWGRLVHQVLEAIGSGRPAIFADTAKEKVGLSRANRVKLEAFIENILTAEEADFSIRERLLDHVESILRSPFWARVMKAERRHFEIPFAIRTSQLELAEIPVILTGTIDLVFWEDNERGRNAGWVIADYKTDYIRPQLIEDDLADLIKIYAPQIRLYTRFWQQITGEPVLESGLYFTSIDRWVKV